MHSVFVDGEGWDWEARVCERAHRYGNVLYVIAFNRVVNGCAALGAEVEDDLVPLVSNSDVLACLAAERDRASFESCLRPENASSSTLTRKAVADGDSIWLGSRCKSELAAAA